MTEAEAGVEALTGQGEKREAVKPESHMQNFRLCTR